MIDSSYYNICFHMLGLYDGYIMNKEQIRKICESKGFDPSDMFERSKRECRNSFYNMGKDVDTNLMTPGAYDVFIKDGHIKNITLDHPRGRTTSSIEAFEKVESGEFGWHNIDEFAEWIREQCKVYWVTSEQNGKLRKFQTVEYAHLPVHERYYLVEDMLPSPDMSHFREKPDLRKLKAEKRREKPMYIIENIVYSSNTATEKFNISHEELERRCKNKGKKWQTWQKKENQ